MNELEKQKVGRQKFCLLHLSKRERDKLGFSAEGTLISACVLLTTPVVSLKDLHARYLAALKELIEEDSV